MLSTSSAHKENEIATNLNKMKLTQENTVSLLLFTFVVAEMAGNVS